MSAGANLLIVLGQPLRPEHTDAITDRVVEGLSSVWDNDAAGTDLKTELRNFINKNVPPEATEFGEYAIRTDTVSVLINPTITLFQDTLRHLLTQPANYNFILHSGPIYQGTGSWILNDGTFSTGDFQRFMHGKDITDAFEQINPDAKIVIAAITEGNWTDSGPHPATIHEKVSLNPKVANSLDLSSADCAADLKTYLKQYLSYVPIEDLLPASSVIGSLRFNRPAFYIFPGGEGDAAMFGVGGFTFLFDGGCQRRSGCWDFVRNLDRIDAVLVSRLSTGNVRGVDSIIQRIATDKGKDQLPKIGYAFMNAPDPEKGNPLAAAITTKHPLIISGYKEGYDLIASLSDIHLHPHHCFAASPPAKALSNVPVPTPLTLFSKVGHGQLVMYTLSPLRDGKDYKEFMDHWRHQIFNQRRPGAGNTSITSAKSADLASIAVLLVWQPADPNENIIRILYPGSLPQAQLFTSLKRLDGLDLLKHSHCTRAAIVHAAREKTPNGLPLSGRRTAPSAAGKTTVSPPKPTAKPSPPAKAGAPAVAGSPKKLLTGAAKAKPLASPIPEVSTTPQSESEYLEEVKGSSDLILTEARRVNGGDSSSSPSVEVTPTAVVAAGGTIGEAAVHVDSAVPVTLPVVNMEPEKLPEPDIIPFVSSEEPASLPTPESHLDVEVASQPESELSAASPAEPAAGDLNDFPTKEAVEEPFAAVEAVPVADQPQMEAHPAPDMEPAPVLSPMVNACPTGLEDEEYVPQSPQGVDDLAVKPSVGDQESHVLDAMNDVEFHPDVEHVHPVSHEIPSFEPPEDLHSPSVDDPKLEKAERHSSEEALTSPLTEPSVESLTMSPSLPIPGDAPQDPFAGGDNTGLVVATNAELPAFMGETVPKDTDDKVELHPSEPSDLVEDVRCDGEVVTEAGLEDPHYFEHEDGAVPEPHPTGKHEYPSGGDAEEPQPRDYFGVEAVEGMDHDALPEMPIGAGELSLHDLVETYPAEPHHADATDAPVALGHQSDVHPFAGSPDVHIGGETMLQGEGHEHHLLDDFSGQGDHGVLICGFGAGLGEPMEAHPVEPHVEAMGDLVSVEQAPAHPYFDSPDEHAYPAADDLSEPHPAEPHDLAVDEDVSPYDVSPVPPVAEDLSPKPATEDLEPTQELHIEPVSDVVSETKHHEDELLESPQSDLSSGDMQNVALPGGEIVTMKGSSESSQEPEMIICYRAPVQIKTMEFHPDEPHGVHVDADAPTPPSDDMVRGIGDVCPSSEEVLVCGQQEHPTFGDAPYPDITASGEPTQPDGTDLPPTEPHHLFEGKDVLGGLEEPHDHPEFDAQNVVPESPLGPPDGQVDITSGASYDNPAFTDEHEVVGDPCMDTKKDVDTLDDDEDDDEGLNLGQVAEKLLIREAERGPADGQDGDFDRLSPQLKFDSGLAVEPDVPMPSFDQKVLASPTSATAGARADSPTGPSAGDEFNLDPNHFASSFEPMGKAFGFGAPDPMEAVPDAPSDRQHYYPHEAEDAKDVPPDYLELDRCPMSPNQMRDYAAHEPHAAPEPPFIPSPVGGAAGLDTENNVISPDDTSTTTSESARSVGGLAASDVTSPSIDNRDDVDEPLLPGSATGASPNSPGKKPVSPEHSILNPNAPPFFAPQLPISALNNNPAGAFPDFQFAGAPLAFDPVTSGGILNHGAPAFSPSSGPSPMGSAVSPMDEGMLAFNGNYNAAPPQHMASPKPSVEDLKREWGKPLGMPAPRGAKAATSARAGGEGGGDRPRTTATGPAKTATGASSGASAGKPPGKGLPGKRPASTSSASGAMKSGSTPSGPSSGPKAETGSGGARNLTSKNTGTANAGSRPGTKAGAAVAAKRPIGQRATGTAPTKPLSRPGSGVTAARPGAMPNKSRAPGHKGPTAGRKPMEASDAAKRVPPGSAAPASQLTNPYHFDLVYLPHHGNPGYIDSDFFKWIRSKHYVLSGLSPAIEVLDAALEGKKTWNEKNTEMTIIPTYDCDTLGLWLALHSDELAEEHLDIAPSASRCTLNLQDYNRSCAAYRIEF